MGKARNIANLVDANGDVIASALDNVPAANLIDDTTPQLGGNLDTNGNNITFNDNDRAIFGDGSDLQIYHDVSHSYIVDNGTGNLRIKAQNFQVLGNADDEAQIEAYQNDGVYLYFNGNQKLATTSGGISITGNATFADNGKAIFGDGSDLQIYHDSSNNNSYIYEGGTGSLYIGNNGVEIGLLGASNTEYLAKFVTNGQVELMFDNDIKLATTATGVDVNGTITADGLTVDGTALMSTTNELQFFTSAYGIRASTGLEIKTGDFTRFLEGTTEHLRIASGGNVGIGTSLPDTSPSTKLHIREDDAVDYKARAVVQATDQRLVAGSHWQSGVTAYSYLQATNDAETIPNNLLLNPDGGNVGIGTDSPAAKLEVLGSDDANNLIVGHNDTDFAVYTDSTVGEVRLKAEDGSGSNFSKFMSFYTQPSGSSAAERMRIDSSGNVGINTSSPSQSLHVVGEGLFEKASADSVVEVSSTGGSGRSYQIRSQTSGDFYIYDNTASAARVTINSSGNVGIGKTPSTALDVNGTVTATAFAGDGSGLTGVSSGATLHAWANFNQTGTQTINDSVGISSLTDNGGGTTTLNFSSAMANTTFTATSGHMNGGTKFQYHDSDSASNVKVVNRDVDGGGGEDGDEIATQVAGDAA